MWDSNANCGLARDKEKKRERENFPMKSPNLRHCQARSQNKGLRKYQRRVSRLRTGPSSAGDNQAGVGEGSGQPWPKRGNCSPSKTSSTKLQAGFVANQNFLGFRTVDITRNQLPRRDTWHTWEGAPIVHPENQGARTGEAIRHTPHLGVTALAKHLVTWAARNWEGHKMQAQPSLCLCGVPENLNLSGLDLGSARKPGPASDSSHQRNLEPENCRPWKNTCLEWGQTQWGWNTGSTPHTRQWYLFAVFLPPHSTTEQVSLEKWPPLLPGVRAEVRHWRDQQREDAKINRGNRFGSDRCNRLKPWGKHWLLWKGPVDLEKYKPDQETIWNWTDPALSATAPDKVLDIFLLLSFFFHLFLLVGSPL